MYLKEISFKPQIKSEYNSLFNLPDLKSFFPEELHPIISFLNIGFVPNDRNGMFLCDAYAVLTINTLEPLQKSALITDIKMISNPIYQPDSVGFMGDEIPHYYLEIAYLNKIYVFDRTITQFNNIYDLNGKITLNGVKNIFPYGVFMCKENMDDRIAHYYYADFVEIMSNKHILMCQKKYMEKEASGVLDYIRYTESYFK